MTVLTNQHYPIHDSIARPWTLMHLMSIAELIRSIDRPRGSADDWWEAHENAAKEAGQGVSIRMGMIVAVGQKHEDCLNDAAK